MSAHQADSSVGPVLLWPMSGQAYRLRSYVIVCEMNNRLCLTKNIAGNANSRKQEITIYSTCYKLSPDAPTSLFEISVLLVKAKV